MTSVDITVDKEGNVTAAPSVVGTKVAVAHHIAPLVVLLAYGGLFVWFMIYTTLWFTHLETAAQTVNVTAWIGASQTMLAGLAGFVFKFYTGWRTGDEH
jgi:hypothetical protein